MVTRTSDPVSFGSTGQSVRVQGSSVGNAPLDPNRFTQEFNRPAAVSPDTSTERVLSAVLGVGSKLAERAFQMDLEEQYLAGVAKAGTIESEAELEGNPLTRDWQVAGYRDTMGRVALAENEAKVATDMARMREASPAQYEQYLAENRRELMPTLQGMSRKQREATFGNMMLNDRAAIKKHAVEHAKFQIETETKSIQGSMRAQVAALNAAKGDEQAYLAANQAAYGAAWASIAQNDKLPMSVKGKLVSELAEYALASDNQKLYESLVNTQTTLEDGTKATLSSYLSWDDEVKLNTQYRASLERTEAFRAADYTDRKAQIKTAWDDPNSPIMMPDEARAFALEGVQKRFMNRSEMESFMTDYYKSNAKKVTNSTLAACYAAGDAACMFAQGKTRKEGLDAWMEKIGRNMPMDQAVQHLLQQGVLNGGGEALAKVGELLQPAIAQMGLNDTVNPDSAKLVGESMKALEAAEKAGKTGMYASFLSAFPEDTKAKLLTMREAMRAGQSPEQSALLAHKRIVDDAAMTPAQRAAVGSANAKEDIAIVSEIEARGLLGTITGRIASVFSTSSGDLAKITPGKSWFENPERVAEVTASSKTAMLQALNRISITNPHMNADSRRDAALAMVAAQTVPTSSGPFIVPIGQNVASYFGVPSNTPTDRIGAAINEFFKPGEGNRIAFTAVEGKLSFRELNADGKLVRGGVVDPRTLGPMVEAQQQREADKFKVLYDTGTTVKGTTGVPVTFNGNNSAGVTNEIAYNIRTSIVKHEDVRDTPYLDTKGKKTVGVGIAETNDNFPKIDASGKVSQQVINATFMAASNAAIKTGVQVQKATGLLGASSIALFSELAYQGGPGFVKHDSTQKMVKAMRIGDEAGAIAALKQTPMYQASKADSARAKHYETMLKGAMKGI